MLDDNDKLWIQQQLDSLILRLRGAEARIDSLESRVNDLSDRVTKLENRT